MEFIITISERQHECTAKRRDCTDTILPGSSCLILFPDNFGEPCGFICRNCIQTLVLELTKFEEEHQRLKERKLP